MKNEFTISEAFKALNDVEDLDIQVPVKNKSVLKRKLSEGGITVNLNDDAEIKDAQAELAKKEDEPALQIIDVETDTLDGLKKNDEYIGQIVLKCEVCKALKFIDSEDLVKAEEEEGVYNVDDECPHCHAAGKGFSVLGQVGKVPTFDNDVEEVKEEEVQENNNDIYSKKEEDITDFDNTLDTDDEVENFELDDTEDLDLPKLGDEFDVDDVRADDTEEVEESLEEDKEEAEKEEEIKVEETEEEVDEEPEDVEEVEKPKCIDLRNKILEAEEKDITIYENTDEGKKVFEGQIKEIPFAIRESNLAGFNTPYLIINIDKSQTPGEKDKVKYFLELFNDDAVENISVYDVAQDEELVNGKAKDILEKYGEEYLVSFEVPSKLILFIDKGEKEFEEVDEPEFTEEDALVADIIKENYLNINNINKVNSNEYWINESVKSREDLNFIYEHYVFTTANKSLIERFKKVTNFKDVIDEARENFESKIQNNNRPFNENLTESDYDDFYNDVNNTGFKLVDKYGPKGLTEKEIDYAFDDCVSEMQGRINTDYPNNDYVNNDLGEAVKSDEALARGDKEEAEEIRKDIQYYEEKEDDQPYNAGKYDDEIEHLEKCLQEDVEETVYFDDVRDGDVITDENLETLTKDVNKKFFPLDVNYQDIEIQQQWKKDWTDDDEDVEIKEDKIDYTYQVEKIDDELVWDLICNWMYDNNVSKFTKSDLEKVTKDQIKEYLRDVFREKAEEKAQEEFGGVRYYSDLEEELNASAKDELINKVADKLDKVIEREEIEVQTVTDEDNPGQIGFLFVSKEDREKAKPVIERTFKELRCVPGDLEETEEDNTFGLIYDKIAIQLGLGIKEQLCKNRKELVKAISECKENGKSYKINKSLKEGYRYSLVEENTSDLTVVDSTEKTLRPSTTKALSKLMEVAKDTVEALKEFYNIDVAPEFIVGDMMKDLGLISGEIDVNSLEENDITRKMFKGFNEFCDAFDEIASMVSGQTIRTTEAERFISALRMLESPNFSKEEIRKAISSPAFLELAKQGEINYIEPSELRVDLIEQVEDDGSDLFETPDTIEDEADEIITESTEDANDEAKENCKDEIKAKLAALTQDEWEASKGYTDAVKEIKDACVEADCECAEKINNVLDDINDEELVHVGELEELINIVDDNAKDLIKDGQEEAEEKLEVKDEVEEVIEETGTEDVEEAYNPDDAASDEIDNQADTEIDFDTVKFDDEMNAYFNEAYEDGILYRTEKGSIDSNGNIILEGFLDAEDASTPVKFLLQPTDVLTEGLENKTYRVSNNLSEEVFEFKF